MWLGPQTLPFYPHLADSHMGHGGGESSHSSPIIPALYSLLSGSTDQHPTMQPCSMGVIQFSVFSFFQARAKLCAGWSRGCQVESGSVSILEKHTRTAPGLHSAPAQLSTQRKQSHQHPPMGCIQVALVSNRQH